MKKRTDLRECYVELWDLGRVFFHEWIVQPAGEGSVVNAIVESKDGKVSIVPFAAIRFLE